MKCNGKEVCPKDCQNRDAYCHVDCETYLDYKAEREKVREERLKQYRISNYETDSIRRTQAGRYLNVGKYKPREG